jgi:hypothetical protein
VCVNSGAMSNSAIPHPTNTNNSAIHIPRVNNSP